MPTAAEMSPDVLLPRIFDKIDEDYSFLLDCLSDVLREMGQPEVAEVVLRVSPRSGAGASVQNEVTPAEEMHVLSIVFQLLNLVEENAAAQTRRQREAAEGFLKEPGLWGQNLRQLRDSGFTEKDVLSVFSRVHVEPVLTAHPTESKRPTVLGIHRAIYLLIVQLENQMWTPAEREDIHDHMRAVLERLWRTGQIFLRKPEVTSERDNLFHYLVTVFPAVLERLDRRFEHAWTECGFDPKHLGDPRNYPRLTFGSWVGGDRDGHPFVTAEVTHDSLDRMRAAGISVIDEHLRRVGDALSLSSRLQEPPLNLRGATIRLVDQLGNVARKIIDRNMDEPWRQYVGLVRGKLALEPDGSPAGYRNGDELAADLAVLRRSLSDVQADRIARDAVFPVERIVRVFGLHLASLDIRQNSAFHDRAVEQLLAVAGFPETGFSEWTEEKRLQLLNRELASPRPFAPPGAALGHEAKSVMECYRVVLDRVELAGGEGIGSLIISMTRSLSDLLVVYLLAREVGMLRAEGGGLVCVVPVVPLFETVEDLDRAPDIIDGFLTHPVTRQSLNSLRREGTKPTLQVMVGYSDSNKDGGILSAQWHLHRSQQRMTAVAHRHGVNLRFFHGRGGTTSRGAGPTHRFLEALPHGSLTGGFRLTEQGETIAQKYANLITATYNMELLMAGCTATTLKHSRSREAGEELTAIFDQLAEFSRDAYASLIASDRFIEFWSQATPIDALENSMIGSRPSRRTGKRSIDDLRAIPWVFSWNQARYYLPGWYGIGTALARLRENDSAAFGMLCDRGARNPFLRYVLTNAETSLASAKLEIMELYASLVKDEPVRRQHFATIEAEHKLTQSMIDEVFHAPRDARRPRMMKTLDMRDAGLSRLHELQVGLLREWRSLRDAADLRQDEVLPVVQLSVNAIAAGLRTTG